MFFGLVFFVNFFSSPSIEYEFYDLEGSSVDFDKYKQKHSILTFTLTSCPTTCPMINAELKKLKLKYGNEINILSINVDPKNDSPDRIKEFMNLNDYDWDILTGSISEIEKVMEFMLYSDRKLEMPGYHLPNLHLMNKDFDYVEGLFPVPEDMNDLILKLDKLL